MICLLPEKIAEFKQALKERQIKIEDLLNMTTEARTALLRRYAGDNAKQINTLFEEKLVLKNRLQGIKNWASKVGEIGRYDPTKKAQIQQAFSEYRARQQERIFNPKENEAFLADLAEKKLGTSITKEEAKSIFDLSARTEELKKGYDEKTGQWSSPKAAADYGAAKVLMEKYVNSVKDEGLPIKTQIKGEISELKQTFAVNKPKAVLDLGFKTLKFISDNAISIVASIDNSFIGRQGLKTLITHPSVWWKGAIHSFVDIAKTLGGQNMKDALLADIYAKENYMNGNYELAKLLPKSEEQFPTSLPERIPLLGRAFKASQIAFEGSAIRMRTGLYDLLSEKAKTNGVNMDDPYQIKSIGTLVNSLTARGQFGTRGEPAVVRLILWAPRMLKGNIDVLSAHVGQDISPFARKQAAFNLLKIVSTTATVMMIANAIKPGSAELDPRSSDFGKIKAGTTRFDITGGAGSLIVLAARLISGSTKSTTSGAVTQYGSGYGQTSRFDAVINFLTGKTAPAARVVVDLFQGKNYQGQKPTLASELTNVAVPISIQNIIQLKDNSSASAVLGVILDALGFNANTYTVSQSDWAQNPGKELQQFRKRVGDTLFKQANDKYNQQYNAWFSAVTKNPRYTQLSNEDKQTVITNKKTSLKDAVLRQYGFVYKAIPKKPLPKL